MESRHGNGRALGLTQSAVLSGLYESSARLYLVRGKYVHLHFYTSDPDTANLLARALEGRVRPHTGTYAITFTSMASLRAAALVLDKCTLGEECANEVRALLEYTDPNKRRPTSAATIVLNYTRRKLRAGDVSGDQ